MHSSVTLCPPLPLPLPSLSLTAANSNAEPAQYKMMSFSNRKGTSNGEYDVPCQMEELEHTIGPCCYEVPCPSTLPPSFEPVLGANTEEYDTLQGETHYNRGCHDNGPLCNLTATSTDGNVSEHEYQEADTLPKSAHPLLEVSVLTIWPPVPAHMQCNACLLVPHVLSVVVITAPLFVWWSHHMTCGYLFCLQNRNLWSSTLSPSMVLCPLW